MADDLTIHIEELIVDGSVDEATVAAALGDRAGGVLDAATLAEVSRAVMAATADTHRTGG